MCSKSLEKEILKLKDNKNAVILAHSYQRPEIQEIADFVGDSLELAKAAKKTDADVIVFCGVDFMAETAAILNPDKTVLIPSRNATCPMASQLSAELVRRVRDANPEVPFVAYVNSCASVKAEADVCCTSANAAGVVDRLDSETVFLGPDANLAAFAERRTGKRVIAVPENGFCYVHKAFSVADVRSAREKYPDAAVIVHPECDPEVQREADYVGSTSQMLDFAEKCDYETIVVGTEIGLVERMRREISDKTFVPLRRSVCREMKLTSLKNLLEALQFERYVVSVPDDVAAKARRSIERMMG